MVRPEPHRLTRQIVMPMLAGIVLGVGLNQLEATAWVQMLLVDACSRWSDRCSWRR
jgi:hypothetical protein